MVNQVEQESPKQEASGSGGENTDIVQGSATNSGQTEAVVVVSTIPIAATTTKDITPQPRMMACSPRCIVMIIFLLVLMLLGVYLSFIAMAVLNGGINKEIDRFSNENDRLEKINNEFTLQNEDLQHSVQDITSIGDQLDVKQKQRQKQNGQFRVSLDNLEEIEADLKIEIANLKVAWENLNETSLQLQYGIMSLQGSQFDLNYTVEQIESQIADYRELREQIEDYINGTDSSAIQAVKDFNQYADRLRFQAKRSIKLTLFNQANSAEKFQDRIVGFTQAEIDRLESQTLDLLNSTGVFQPPPQQFPKNQTGIVPAVKILEILQSFIDAASDDILAASIVP